MEGSPRVHSPGPRRGACAWARRDAPRAPRVVAVLALGLAAALWAAYRGIGLGGFFDVAGAAATRREAQRAECRAARRARLDRAAVHLPRSLVGELQFARRVLRRHCGRPVADLLDAHVLPPRHDGDGAAALSLRLDHQLALLANISAACPDSHLPYVGRELWPHHADAVIMDDVSTASQAAGALARGCPAAAQASRACIVFLHTRALAAAAGAVVAYLDDERSTSGGAPGAAPRSVVVVSSSNVDLCVPFWTYRPGEDGTDADAPFRMPGAAALLRHPGLRAWFAENPCLRHEKLVPLPIGAKFKWRETAFGREDWRPQKAGLAALLDTSTQWARRACRDGMLIAMDPATSDLAEYAPHVGVRRAWMEHMQAVAAALPSGLLAPPSGGRSLAAGAADAARRPGVPAGAAGALPPPPTAAAAGGARGARQLLAYGAYLQGLAGHRFAWSPPGRGQDAHRTWECLMGGCVPVVVEGPISPLYDGLQVVQVRSFGEVTARALDAAWAALPSDSPADWLAPQLFGFHWLERIERAAAGGGG